MANNNKTVQLILIDCGQQKIDVIKVIRQLTNLGLKEAKDLVEETNSVILGSVDLQLALKYKAELESVGATVKLSGEWQNTQSIVELQKQLINLERAKHEAEAIIQKETPSNSGSGLLIFAGVIFVIGLIFTIVSGYLAVITLLVSLILAAVALTIRSNRQTSEQSTKKKTQQKLKLVDEEIIEITHKLTNLKTGQESVFTETDLKHSREPVQSLQLQNITDTSKIGQLDAELRKA
jgi:hypothetical protein